jgi:Resolvase, N terminal domain
MMAYYCRVSTRRQKADSQKADILRWLTGHAVPPATIQWFEDVESGTTLRRPAFDRMQQGIFMGTITTVVVWKLDRISRRQREGVNLLADWCGGARQFVTSINNSATKGNNGSEALRPEEGKRSPIIPFICWDCIGSGGAPVRPRHKAMACNTERELPICFQPHKYSSAHGP